MSIASICHRRVVAINPEADLAEAAQMMRTHHVGYLIVVKDGGGIGGKPEGVLTDRDIVVEVIARQTDPHAVTVADAMSTTPLTIYERATVADTLHHMREYGVRRAPVVDAQGQLVGVIALDDIVEHLADELSHVAATIRNEQRIEQQLRG